MAEAHDEHKLPDIFKEIWKKLHYLDKTEESTSSDKVQGYIHHACEVCKTAMEMVNTLQLFSDNEDIEEVATNELKYMLLPALMGYFLMKNTVRDRLRVVKESQDFYMDFIRLCRGYNVTDIDVQDTPDTELAIAPVQLTRSIPSPNDLRSMGLSRNGKIQRYKEQQEYEKKLHALRDDVEKDHVDDEVKRDYYITLLRRWVNVCIDELDCIQTEISILELMAKHKKDKKHDDGLQMNKVQHKPPPMRPFIITKNNLQKQVYGLGYPSLPTVTIEEFCEQKIADGDLHLPGAPGHSMQDWAMDPDKDKEAQEQECAEKEERLDRDDPDELRKAREWNEYTDDHRRGWGNRKNMG